MAKFRATEEQIKHLLATATNASAPVGLGFLHYNPDKVFTAEDFEHPEYGTDYVQGRMVKCRPFSVKDEPGVYELREPRSDYQSWAVLYPTAKDLIEAAGLKVIEEAQPAEQGK